ncbi:MAG: hypothetical protein LAN62_10710 [Acidobacteriia bacterium]|nr:hypothetical protein [Terriglobia bacterium]
MSFTPRCNPVGQTCPAAWGFVEENGESPTIGPADIEALHKVGWSDEAIYDAIAVCALFNFYNRWIDATGVHEMPEGAHRLGGKRRAERGYIVTKPNRRLG